MLTHFDCFAGPGGITTGFTAAGIHTVGAVEKVASCAETFSHNHPHVRMFNMDIRKLSRKALNEAGIKNVDIVTAGMPCETFSTAGSTSRSFYDDRQMLFNEGIRVASLLGAKLILLENVPAITSKKLSRDTDELVIDKIYESLSASGYKYFIDTILDSSDFGIPQKRKRFFQEMLKNYYFYDYPIVS
jgi:DNA (cytosine-5)-methyltransferase 1